MKRTIEYFKALFITGYTPTQDDFADIFDSFQPTGTIGIDIRKIKLLTNSEVTEIVFTPSFEEGATWQLMGKPNCTNADGEVWCSITNPTNLGFILNTEIGVNFECVAIKI